MSIQEEFNNVREEMSEYHRLIKEKIDSTATGEDTNVPYAENADRLDGMDSQRVMDVLRQKVRQHIESLTNNVHGVLPADVNTYSVSEFTEIVDDYTPYSSGAPFSFYGDREYFRPDVAGSFESSSNWLPWGSGVAMFLEDNGTLSMLRTGTDGSNAGVYYSYLKDAGKALNFRGMVMSNMRYQPSYFPAGQVAKCVLWSGQDICIGVLMNASTKEHTGYFISLLNGTLDHNNHTGIVVPINDFIPTEVVATYHLAQLPMGYVRNNTVTILIDEQSGDSPTRVGFQVWDIPLSNLITGNYTGAVQRTGWTVRRGPKSNNVGNTIRVSDTYDELVNFQPGITSVDTVNNTAAPYVLVDGSNRVWLFFVRRLALRAVDAGLQDQSTSLSFVMEITDNKIINLDNYFNSPPSISIANNEIVINDRPLSHAGLQSLHWTAFVVSSNTARTYIAPNHAVFTYRSNSTSTNRILQREVYPESSPIVEIGSGDVASTAFLRQQFESRYAGPVSNRFRDFWNHGDQVIGGSSVKVIAGVTSRDNFRAGSSGQLNYAYPSLDPGMYSGFEPTTDRKWLSEITPTPVGINRLLNETDENGVRLSHARFNTLPGSVLSGSATISDSMVGSGSLTASSAVIASLLTQLKARIIADGNGIYNDQVFVELVVPQRYTALTAFVYGGFIDSTESFKMFVCSVTVNSRTAVTSATLVAGSIKYATPPISQGNQRQISRNAEVGSGGQLVIRRVGTSYAVGLTYEMTLTSTSSTVRPIALVNFTTAGGWEIFDSSSLTISAEDSGFFNSPTHGLMFTFNAENFRYSIDAGTKILGIPALEPGQVFTKNIATLRSSIPDKAFAKVLLSQKAASAWTLYFSDDVPYMLDGNYGVISSQLFELDSVADANRTIRFWLILETAESGGAVYYRRTYSSTVPSGGNIQFAMFLGRVVTNADGIVSINLDKRVMVGPYYISRTRQGSSIPVTSGVPATAGRLNWR